MNRFLVTFWVLWCMLGATLVARPKNFLFTDSYLSSNLVNNIFQDSDGFLWISTENGLNRFDGAKMTCYFHEKDNPHSLAHNFVCFVHEDREGNLLVGSYLGVQLYHRDTDDFTEVACFEDGSALTAAPSYLVETRDGRIYTSGNVICQIVVREGVPQLKKMNWNDKGMVSRLHEDAQGYLWCRNGVGDFYRISPDGRMELIQLATQYGAVDVFSDGQYNIYISTRSCDLWHYDADRQTWSKINNTPVSRAAIRCVFSLDDKTLLVGTDGNGVKCIDKKSGRVEDYEVDLPALTSDLLKVHQIFRDREGNLWLALFMKGVAHLFKQKSVFQSVGPMLGPRNPIGTNSIGSILSARDGRMWVGTDGDGIYVLDKDLGASQHYLGVTSKGTFPSIVLALYEDSDGKVWVGSYGESCGYVEPGTGRYHDCGSKFRQEGNIAPRVYGFVEDKWRRLWVATMGSGTFCYDLDKQQTIDSLCFFDSINVWQTSVRITSDDQLLVGTYDGVLAFDLTAKHITPRRVFDRHIIYSLEELDDGSLWAAGPSGVIQFDAKQGPQRLFTQGDGLAGNVAYSILGDSAQTLWVATNKGISHYVMADSSFTNYMEGDGLQGNEFAKNACCTDRKGRIWMGGMNGINYFYPSQVHADSSQLQVRVTGFYLHNKPINASALSGGKPIIKGPVYKAKYFSLLHEDNTFSIELSTTNFVNPTSVRYMYSINDGTWSTLPMGSHQVSFGSLRPGRHSFRFKAVQNLVSSPEEEVIIIVRPFWWESPVTQLSAYLLAVLIVLAFFVQMRHHYRVRREMLIEKHAHEIDEAKLRFFTNITHDIRTPMTLIMSPLQKLLETDMDQVRQQAYQTMKRNANMLLQLVNQLLDIRKIDNNQMKLHFKETDIIRLLNEQMEFFVQVAESKQIKTSFVHDGFDNLPVWVDSGYFCKIVINLLSNAFKYTPSGGEVTMSVEADPMREDGAGYVILRVSDTGIGISQEDKEHIFERFYRAQNARASIEGNGIGLHLTRSLVTLHHGTIRVYDNEEGPGTTFEVRLPLGNQHLQPEELVPDSVQKIVESKVVVKVDEQQPDRVSVVGKVAANRVKYHLLIVDDDNEIRNYLKRELEADFHVTVCADGKAALESIFNQAPDIVLSDVMMPELDGLSLCQRIKQNINLNHIPVVLLTAKVDSESNIAGLECGADAYITKPFYIEILRSTLNNLLKSRSVLRNNFSGQQEQAEKRDAVNLTSADDQLMEKIMQSVNRNLSNPNYSTEELGSDVGLSRVHLYRRMKELTNQGPQDFIRNMRLREAARLLEQEPSISVFEIAAAVGFKRANNFSAAFKDLYGMSPLQWRARSMAKSH